MTRNEINHRAATLLDKLEDTMTSREARRVLTAAVRLLDKQAAETPTEETTETH